MPNLHAIIMAGGSGTRFWPASRRHRPKHFLHLTGDRSLIQSTVDRMTPLVGGERVWIVTGPEQAKALPTVLRDFPTDHILVEPAPRDTAPCVALATAEVEARDPGAAMAFLPADHLIEPAAELGRLLQRATALAADGSSLVALGIRPRRPATGYGYIEQGPELDALQPSAFRATRFVEKPDLATATGFVESGRFLWNSGVFVWTAAALLRAMRAGNPELGRCTESLLRAAAAADRGALEQAFHRIPATSVDYAVMEKAPSVVVLHTELQWTDLGSFAALEATSPADADGNVIALQGGARALLEASKNCVVYGDGPRATALFGVEDLIVVTVEDAVLVCHKDRAEDLKKLVGRLPDAGLGDLL